jgi:hypothetical protein
VFEHLAKDSAQRQYKQKDYERIKEKKDLENCTFVPKINKSNSDYFH